MVIRISDKTQNYSKVTKLLVKPTTFNSVLVVIVELFFKIIKIEISFGEKLNS